VAGEADGIDRGRETLLRALSEGGVRFVVIGGAALQSHGQRYETEDIDITPDRTQENLKRLADVLNRCTAISRSTPNIPSAPSHCPTTTSRPPCSPKPRSGIYAPCTASSI
jgi:hypothetical protein